MYRLFQESDSKSVLLKLAVIFAILLVFHLLISWIMDRLAKKHPFFLLALIKKYCYNPALASITIAVLYLALPFFERIPIEISRIVGSILTIALIACITFLLIRGLAVIKQLLVRRYDFKSDDNLHARKVFTQFQIMERIIVFILIVFAVSIALMSFESIRQIGVSLLASAGVVGIILGFAAQKSFSTIFAGIQIAIAQPIRLDDVVVVEGEWGRIEEIFLTYVTVRLWDDRRLIVPVNYFLDKPFQNWTRTTSQLTGTVFIYADYTLPIEPLREELTRILNESVLWDKRVNVLQVTDSSEQTIQVRALMSASNSSATFDLRCQVREKLITFLQQYHPEHLAKTRLYIENPTNILTT